MAKHHAQQPMAKHHAQQLMAQHPPQQQEAQHQPQQFMQLGACLMSDEQVQYNEEDLKNMVQQYHNVINRGGHFGLITDSFGFDLVWVIWV